MRHITLALIPFSMLLAAVGFAVAGWCMNLVAVGRLVIDSAPVTTMFIGRAVGVFFAPLGAVLGYF